MKRFKSTLAAIVANLKLSNELFADQIHVLDHKGRDVDENQDKLRISDSLSSYAIIEPVPMDDRIERSQVVGTNLLLWKRFKLLSDCSDCDRDILLEFCLQNLMRTPGVKPVSMSSDSERIYLEETREEPKQPTNLIRVVFDITTPITVSKTQICLSLCSTTPC